MSFRSYRRRLRELPWLDRLLLAETVATLAAASLAIGLLPFRRVVSFIPAATPREEENGPPAEAVIARTKWAIEACARLLPWRIVCFQKGLAMQWMLRRRRIGSFLHYGVRQDEERGVTAHVWITHRDLPILGGEEAAGFACLAVYPKSSAPDSSRRRDESSRIRSHRA
jgi:hypothetical protein